MNVRIIVPHTAACTQPTSYVERIAAITGGYTCMHGIGGWIDDSGKLCDEPVTIIDTDVDARVHGSSRKVSALRQVAYDIGVDLKQDAVYFRCGDQTSEMIRVHPSHVKE